MDPENYLSTSENVAQLQRLHRITEGDRRAYCRDTEVTLLRQRKIIQKLEAEREKILSQVSAGDDGTICRVADLNTMLDVYKRKRLQLHQERHIVQNQVTEIQNLEKEIGKLIVGKKKHRKCDSQQQDDVPINATTKRIDILEDRLQNASVHYNRLLYDSGRLREDIEGLLKQRNVHRRILRSLGCKMSQLKAHMEGLADEAIRNYNAREVAYEKLQALKCDHLVGDRLCKSQVQEAQRVLELQKTLFEFVATKNRRRTAVFMSAAGLSTPRKSGTPFTRMLSRGDRSRSLKEAPIGDTELFSYTSNLNNKVEDLQSEIDCLFKECKSLVSLRIRQEEQHKDAVKELEALLADLSGQCEAAQAEAVGREKIFENLKSSIDVMLRVVGRRPTIVESPIALVDDGNGGMFKPAIVKTIKDIESCVDEILRNKNFLVNKLNGELDAKLTPSPSSLNKRRSTKVDFQPVLVSHPSFDIAVTPPDLALPEVVDLQADVDGSQVDTLFVLVGKNVHESSVHAELLDEDVALKEV